MRHGLMITSLTFHPNLPVPRPVFFIGLGITSQWRRTKNGWIAMVCSCCCGAVLCARAPAHRYNLFFRIRDYSLLQPS